MSRTFRRLKDRKGGHNHNNALNNIGYVDVDTGEWHFWPWHSFGKEAEDNPSKEVIEWALRRYWQRHHTDSGSKCMCRSVPKTYRKLRNNHWRNVNRKEMQRAWQSGDNENYILTKWQTDAAWYYW